MSTISAPDTTTSTPTMVLGYGATRPSRNVTHEIVSRPDLDISIRPAGLRKGTLQLGYETAMAAWAAVSQHAQAGRFTFTDTDVPELNMTYVVVGDIAPVLEDETRELWIVTVGFQEVTP